MGFIAVVFIFQKFLRAVKKNRSTRTISFQKLSPPVIIRKASSVLMIYVF